MAGIGNNTTAYDGYKSTRTALDAYDVTGHPGRWAHVEEFAKGTTTYFTGSRGSVGGIMMTHSDASVAGTKITLTGGSQQTGLGLIVGELYELSVKSLFVVNNGSASARVYYTKGYTKSLDNS